MPTQPRVAVVDDEPLIASLVADWLEELGLQVVGPFSSVREAIPSIEQQPPDAALLDVSLGAGDSFSLADAALGKGVRIAFLTGHGADRLPDRFKDIPILGKPFEFKSLAKLMQAMLPGHSAPAN
jgi:DNA-binding response OmpR family regulator